MIDAIIGFFGAIIEVVVETVSGIIARNKN